MCLIKRITWDWVVVIISISYSIENAKHLFFLRSNNKTSENKKYQPDVGLLTYPVSWKGALQLTLPLVLELKEAEAPLETEVAAHVDPPVPIELAKLFEPTDVEVEQLPEPEMESESERRFEAEKLQLLAFAICAGCDITPGIRSTVKTTSTAPIENANLCIQLVTI